MKTLVIYTSQTGFTEKYAEWIAEQMSADLLELTQAKKKKNDFFENYDAIVFGGWIMAGRTVKVNWFLGKAESWKDKKLAVFCVGGSPEGSPDVDLMLSSMLTDEQRKYIRAFYCQGGFNYEKMNGPSKLAMKMFVSALRNKKDKTEDEKVMAEMIAKSYDISDIKYTEPVINYLKQGS